MICSVNPIQSEDFCAVQKKEFSNILSDGKQISGRASQGAWRQDELIGGEPPVVK
jgi:hypothetical protein